MRGGNRPGAGRPQGTKKSLHRKPITIRLPEELIDWLQMQQEPATHIIERAVERERALTTKTNYPEIRVAREYAAE